MLAGLILLVSPSRGEWYKKVIFCVPMAVWLGSYPVIMIRNQRLVRQWFVVFVPLRPRRWKIDRFVQIETDTEEQTGFLSLLFFGFQWWLIWSLCDRLMPWAGGGFRLSFRAASGKRVLAWQGNGERNFRRNLQMLESASGLPVVRG